jgi:hypothetical protein
LQLVQVHVVPQLQLTQLQVGLSHFTFVAFGAFWLIVVVVVDFMIVFFICYLIPQKYIGQPG